MHPEDRDRLFEQALARHLRAAAPASDSACLDPEVLAAYHERLLSPEEMAAAKTHLVSCLRCQEILAQVEATQDLFENHDRESELLPALVLSGSIEQEVTEDASEPAALAKSAEMRPEKVTEFRAKKTSVLRWVAPAGAIAAGLLIWVGIRDFRPEGKRAEPATQVAENRRDNPHYSAPAAATEGASKQEDETLLREQIPEKLKKQPSTPAARDERQNAASLERSSARARADDLKPDKRLPPSAPLSSPAPKIEGLQSGDRTSAANVEKSRAFEEKSVPSDSAALDFTQGKEIEERAVAKPKSDAGIAGGALSARTQPAPSSKTADVAVTAEMTTAAPAELLSHLESSKKDTNQPAAFSRVVLNQNELAAIVAAPGGKSIWRLGEHGAIAHSSDGGKTWESQSAALTAKLTNGSAPSKTVCWIIGTSGTLLRTTNAGKHWQLVTSPISEDLGGVHAVDAKHATIWDVPNRLSYETSDGGVTWKRVANE
jgi:hypothetical protein